MPPPLVPVILQLPWDRLALPGIKVGSVMLSCHVRVISLPFLILLPFVVMILILTASLSSLQPLVSRLSLPHMTLGHMWMLLGEVKSTRLSCPLAVLLHRSHWTKPAFLLAMIYPPWATPLLFDSLVKGSERKWSGPPLVRELPQWLMNLLLGPLKTKCIYVFMYTVSVDFVYFFAVFIVVLFLCFLDPIFVLFVRDKSHYLFKITVFHGT